VNLPAIHGYAFVSENDRIADASGNMPPALRNDTEWAYFQAELDRADLIALARVSHEAAPNVRGRRRLVLSRSASGLERRADAWWWNPQDVAWSEVSARLLPVGGRVAVPGGQAAFDIFLRLGFTAFHLSRMAGLDLSGGRGLFAACEAGVPAARILHEAGMSAADALTIDPAAGVTLTVWRPASRN
jgi:hypothetical protein